MTLNDSLLTFSAAPARPGRRLQTELPAFRTAHRSPATRLPLVERWTLTPDIRRIAVAGEDSCLIGQRKELLAQALHDEREVTQGRLGRARAAGKERVAAEELPIAQKTDAAGRVPRRVQHVERRRAKRDALAIREREVGR